MSESLVAAVYEDGVALSAVALRSVVARVVGPDAPAADAALLPSESGCVALLGLGAYAGGAAGRAVVVAAASGEEVALCIEPQTFVVLQRGFTVHECMDVAEVEPVEEAAAPPVSASAPPRGGAGLGAAMRALVCELCAQFYGLGWVTGTGGSISLVRRRRNPPPRLDAMRVCFRLRSAPAPAPSWHPRPSRRSACSRLTSSCWTRRAT
jgi:hypothetical protein